MIYLPADKETFTRLQLHEIPIPERPDQVGKWKGINHGVLADEVVRYAKKIGFKIAGETWYCSPNRSAMFGSIELDNRGTDFVLSAGTEALYSIGVRHDNGGRYAVSLALGGRVVVCGNGIFTGDFVISSRHYDTLDVRDMVEEGIEEWLTNSYQIQEFVDSLRKVQINNRDAAYLITCASDSVKNIKTGCIGWNYLDRVLDLWYKPNYEQFHERSLWSLYNCFTEVARDISPPRQMRLLKGLQVIMSKFVQGSMN